MKIIFVCGVYPQGMEKYFLSHCKGVGLQNAANVFQWSLIEGLYENQVDFHAVSMPSLPRYPIRYNKMFTPSGALTYYKKKIGVYLRYNTFAFSKDYSQRCRLSNYIKNWLKQQNNDDNEKIVILTYSATGSVLKAITSIKKKNPNVIIASIIADLVDDATNPIFSLSRLKYLQARREQILVKKAYDHIDKFILLSSFMEEKILQSHNCNIVIEGLASKVDTAPVQLKNKQIKTVLYTGAVHEFAGILNLIEAFKLVRENNVKLIICGSGDCMTKAQALSKEDLRIEFKGNVSHEEAISYQHQADLLVNPRLPVVSLTKYSFPSKTMEYLSSGTPMLGYRLDGIPKEYYDHFFTPSDFGVKALAEKIEEILTMTPEALRDFGQKAKDFIHTQKEAKVQVEKIIEFLNK